MTGTLNFSLFAIIRMVYRYCNDDSTVILFQRDVCKGVYILLSLNVIRIEYMLSFRIAISIHAIYRKRR